MVQVGIKIQPCLSHHLLLGRIAEIVGFLFLEIIFAFICQECLYLLFKQIMFFSVCVYNCPTTISKTWNTFPNSRLVSSLQVSELHWNLLCRRNTRQSSHCTAPNLTNVKRLVSQPCTWTAGAVGLFSGFSGREFLTSSSSFWNVAVWIMGVWLQSTLFKQLFVIYRACISAFGWTAGMQ